MLSAPTSRPISSTEKRAPRSSSLDGVSIPKKQGHMTGGALIRRCIFPAPQALSLEISLLYGSSQDDRIVNENDRFPSDDLYQYV